MTRRTLQLLGAEVELDLAPSDWFSPAAREAYRPPEDIDPSEWANRHRVLDDASIESGAFYWQRTPYMREPLDTLRDRWCEQVTFIKSTQVGGTELLRNAIGYIADQDTGPTLLVVPRQDDIGSYRDEVVLPIFDASPRLGQQLTGRRRDRTGKALRFKRCAIYLGAAQSAVDLGRRPIRYLLGDECDKWPERAGKEAAPFGLARERLRTYENAGLSKVLLNSTPTTREGLIHKEWLKSDRRRFHVPCPRCDAFQVLRWEQIRFPKDERDPEAYLANTDLATYHCDSCDEPIDDHEKAATLLRGVWCPDGCRVTPDGNVSGPDGIAPIPRRHRGYHVWAGYSPWVTWSRIVAEWCRSLLEDDLQNFVNSWLGEIWENKVEEPTREKIELCVSPYQRNDVPEGVRVMVAGVDVQKTELKYAIYGWGEGEESWLIRSGKTVEWAELEWLLFDECWGERGLRVRQTLIDCRHRTDEVYTFCRKHPTVCAPILGIDQDPPLLELVPKKIDRDPRTGSLYPRPLIRWACPVAAFKDKLSAHIDVGNAPGEHRAFHVHEDPDEDYVREMSAEHKVRKMQQRGRRRVREMWVKKPGHRKNDFWSASIYAWAAAWMIHVPMIGRAPRKRSNQAPRPRAKRTGGGSWMRGFT